MSSLADKIRAFRALRPEARPVEIADALGLPGHYVRAVLSRDRNSPPKPKASPQRKPGPKRPASAPWTPEQDAQLIKLWKERVLAKEIANRLGRTVPAVLQRAAKFKLGRRISRSEAAKMALRHRGPKHGAPVASKRPPSATGAPVQPFYRDGKRDIPSLPCDPPQHQLVATTALQLRHCRWPIGDPRTPAFGYCGRDRHKTYPYCREHLAVAEAPLPPGARRKRRHPKFTLTLVRLA